MKKEIKLGVSDKQKLFRAYVEMLQPVLKLRNREADVFAQLLYLNDEKKELPEVDRFEIIFSTRYRKIILDNLKMKDASLQNCFSELRKKKLIVNNTIRKDYWVHPDDKGLSIVFNLKVNG